MSTYKGFTTVQLQKPPRSFFDHSHEKRISTRMGKLTPIFIKETLPNDTWQNDSEIMLRLAPLLAPLMHRVNLFVHFFFVANRLLWKEWEKFITHGRLGTETPPVPPNVQLTTLGTLGLNCLDIGSVFDYLGGRTYTDASAITHGARTLDLMPNAAWYKVWYDYYRDRNYVDDNDVLPFTSGAQDATPLTVSNIFVDRYRDWQKDYFTSAQTTTQRGTEVLMPLAGSGTVTYKKPTLVRNAATDALLVGPNTLQVDAAGNVEALTGAINAYFDSIDTVTLSSSSVSINDLRVATSLQKFYERQQLAGSRMNETIWAHFNRRTSDGRLQRAEYLGGGKVTLKMSEVVTTAYSEDASSEVIPPANMAGHSLTFGDKNRFKYNCEEWGFIIGILSVMPNSAYSQGNPRMFVGRNTFLDYPWPTFAHLGEQEVFKYEIYADETTMPVDRTAQPVFGYQSRYADWKYTPSSCHGDFRTTLEYWHLTRKFASLPVLGAEFCTFEDELQDRVFAVSGVDTIWAYVYNNCSVVRSLPYHGTPQL